MSSKKIDFTRMANKTGVAEQYCQAAVDALSPYKVIGISYNRTKKGPQLRAQIDFEMTNGEFGVVTLSKLHAGAVMIIVKDIFDPVKMIVKESLPRGLRSLGVRRDLAKQYQVVSLRQLPARLKTEIELAFMGI